MPPMRAKLRAFWVPFLVMVPLGGFLPGCSQADNPKPTTAPPAPPPQAEETKVPKVGPKSQEYGSNPRYQKAMERMGKQQGQGQ